MNEMKKMNAVEIVEYLTGEGKNRLDNIKVPFLTMTYCVDQAIESCLERDKDGKIKSINVDYTYLRLYRVITITGAILSLLDIEYVYDKEDENKKPNNYESYDDIIDIYNLIPCQYVIEDMIDETVRKLERQEIQLGHFESKIIEIADRMTKTVEGISEVIKDKKKLGGFLKTIKKELGGDFGKLISGIKDGVGSKEV